MVARKSGDTLLFFAITTLLRRLKNFSPFISATVKMPSKPKTARREISETQRAAVVTWHKSGKSYSQISILEALPRSTVSSIVRHAQLRPDNPVATKKRPGRPRKTNPRDER